MLSSVFSDKYDLLLTPNALTERIILFLPMPESLCNLLLINSNWYTWLRHHSFKFIKSLQFCFEHKGFTFRSQFLTPFEQCRGKTGKDKHSEWSDVTISKCVKFFSSSKKFKGLDIQDLEIGSCKNVSDLSIFKLIEIIGGENLQRVAIRCPNVSSYAISLLLSRCNPKNLKVLITSIDVSDFMFNQIGDTLVKLHTDNLTVVDVPYLTLKSIQELKKLKEIAIHKTDEATFATMNSKPYDIMIIDTPKRVPFGIPSTLSLKLSGVIPKIALPDVKVLKLVLSSWEEIDPLVFMLSSCSKSLKSLDIIVHRPGKDFVIDCLKPKMISLRHFSLTMNETVSEEIFKLLYKFCPRVKELILNCRVQTARSIDLVAKFYPYIRGLSLYYSSISALTFSKHISKLLYIKRLRIIHVPPPQVSFQIETFAEITDQNLVLAFTNIGRELEDDGPSKLTHLIIKPRVSFTSPTMLLAFMRQCPKLLYFTLKTDPSVIQEIQWQFPYTSFRYEPISNFHNFRRHSIQPTMSTNRSLSPPPKSRASLSPLPQNRAISPFKRSPSPYQK